MKIQSSKAESWFPRVVSARSQSLLSSAATFRVCSKVVSRLALFGLLALVLPGTAIAGLVYETTSPYHHIRVMDSGGIRTLYFDDAMETQMSLANPLQGHFEYTEFFHMPWLWNTGITSVLTIGLGGGSVQRSFEHYYPEVRIETVEIDPAVLEVAKTYFGFKESERQKVSIEDGRVYLRRSRSRYDLIVMDAYVQGRYGSSIPQHLATKEFFELARDHLSTNGLVAYNVIGSVNAWRSDVVGAIYRTMKAVFPQVYVFPARTSGNVVLVATKAGVRADVAPLRKRAVMLRESGRIQLPAFLQRLESFSAATPPNALRSPILTDDYAPTEGLSAESRFGGSTSRTNRQPQGVR